MAEFAGVPARFGFEQVIGPNQGREVQSEGSLLENSTGSSSQLTTGRRLPFTKGGKTKRDPPFPDVHPGQNYGQTPLPGARIKDIDWRQTSAARRAYLGVGAQVANHHAAVLPWLRATRRPIEEARHDPDRRQGQHRPKDKVNSNMEYESRLLRFSDTWHDLPNKSWKMVRPQHINE